MYRLYKESKQYIAQWGVFAHTITHTPTGTKNRCKLESARVWKGE